MLLSLRIKYFSCYQSAIRISLLYERSNQGFANFTTNAEQKLTEMFFKLKKDNNNYNMKSYESKLNDTI